MKKELSIEQRIEVYDLCYDFLVSCLRYDVYSITICRLLQAELKRVSPSVYRWAIDKKYKVLERQQRLFVVFPEVLYFMPASCRINEIWFSLDAKELKKRIKLMDKVRTEIKNRKKILDELPKPSGIIYFMDTQYGKPAKQGGLLDFPLEERERLYKIVLADLLYCRENGLPSNDSIPRLLFNELSRELVAHFNSHFNSDYDKLKRMFPELYGWSFGPDYDTPWKTVHNASRVGFPKESIDLRIEIMGKVLGVVETYKLYKRKGVYNGF